MASSNRSNNTITQIKKGMHTIIRYYWKYSEIKEGVDTTGTAIVIDLL